jgi:signal transduction histidine kinase
VLREGLTNVTRHSHASRVEIQLTQTNGTVQGTLSDNGVGFTQKNLSDQRDQNRFGLAGMERRIKKIGGELAIKSSPGKGTMLSFAVPADAPVALQE